MTGRRGQTARLMTMAFLAAVFFALTAMSVSAGEPYPTKHPMEVTDATCSMCHGKWAENDHTPDWDRRHRFAAQRDGAICAVCHKKTFCADCHAVREEIKPSDKHKLSPTRFLPHRGDYLTQHMIDGRINPAACFRCHGRQNNARCKACHR